MFVLTIPASRAAERTYVARVILGEFLGLEFQIQESNAARYCRLFDPADASRGITFGDHLFGLPDEKWFSASSLPSLPLTLYSSEIKPAQTVKPAPVLYPSAASVAGKDTSVIDFDLFGSAFFLLTQYEEKCDVARDQHDRLTAARSVTGRAGILERPLVDEYTEILREAVRELWPATRFAERGFRIIPTHDVDYPFQFKYLNAGRAIRSAGGELQRKRKVGVGVSFLKSWRKVRTGDLSADPYYVALNQMIEDDSRAGLRGIFYFMCGHTDARFDGFHYIWDDVIRRLMRKIHDAGHYIGLHNSYGTLNDPAALKNEYETLRSVCESEKIDQDRWYIRSHFLRWRTPVSFGARDRLGVDVDSTLGFADRPGFRCGTCHEFSTFDLDSRKHLRLMEQPLIAMECSLIGGYENLDHPAAQLRFENLRETCRTVRGQFVFLWHNSRLESPKDWHVFRSLMGV